MFGGQVIEGAWLSLTVTVKVQVLPPPLLPVVPKIWKMASGALPVTQVVFRPKPGVHAVPKPPPGLRHTDAELEVVVRSSQPHCPPVPKFMLACTDTQ